MTVSRRPLLAGGGLLFAAAVVGSFAIASQLRLPAETGRSVTETAQLLINSKRLPGISFAVVDGDRIIESSAIGVLDTSSDKPVTSDTLFEAASLTKPVVAYMAMLEVDRGRLELDKPVAHYIGVPARISDVEQWAVVTIRHLLSHRSGLPNWSGTPGDQNRTDPLAIAFEPGTDFSYSGEGYGLLLQAIAAAADTTPEELAATTLADLGMQDSSMTAANLDGTYARGHWRLTPDRPPTRTRHVVAAFSLFTTATDYAQFLIAWMSPPVSLETLRAFAEPAAGAYSELPTGLGWSLGWGTYARDRSLLHFQWGDNGAFRAFAALDSSRKKAIVYLSNGSLGTLQANALTTPALGDITQASDWFARPGRELARLLVRF